MSFADLSEGSFPSSLVQRAPEGTIGFADSSESEPGDILDLPPRLRLRVRPLEEPGERSSILLRGSDENVENQNQKSSPGEGVRMRGDHFESWFSKSSIGGRGAQ